MEGKLISFEGLDGAGKTTQMELLSHWLDEQYIAYVRTREPGGTWLGVEIRHLLLNSPEFAITPLAEAFLFQADRAHHFATMVLPALRNGKLVITDRCFDASIVYQGYARGLGAELIENLSLLATQQRVPDLTILLDLDPIQAQARTHLTNAPGSSREQPNRFDAEEVQFHQRVRDGFLTLASAHPERIKVIDATLSPRDVHKKIVELVKVLLL